MSIQIVLDALIALSGVLALIGLGGAVSSAAWRRRTRPDPEHNETQTVEVTVKQGDGPKQTFNIPQDSVVFDQLSNEHDVHISISEHRVTTETVGKEDKRTEIFGLIGGVIAGISIGVPFLAAGEVAISIAAAIGALLLTGAGLVVGRLKTVFTRDEWKATTTKMQAEAIRDAALLRNIPSQPSDTS